MACWLRKPYIMFQVVSVDKAVQPYSYGVQLGEAIRETEDSRLTPRVKGNAAEPAYSRGSTDTLHPAASGQPSQQPVATRPASQASSSPQKRPTVAQSAATAPRSTFGSSALDHAFGEFRAAPAVSLQPAAPPVHTNASAALHNSVEDDDFGEFSVPIQAAASPATSSRAAQQAWHSQAQNAGVSTGWKAAAPTSAQSRFTVSSSLASQPHPAWHQQPAYGELQRTSRDALALLTYRIEVSVGCIARYSAAAPSAACAGNHC